MAIETRNGQTYLGKTSLEAVQLGLEAHPGSTFVIERLGYRTAAVLKPQM